MATKNSTMTLDPREVLSTRRRELDEVESLYNQRDALYEQITDRLGRLGLSIQPNPAAGPVGEAVAKIKRRGSKAEGGQKNGRHSGSNIADLIEKVLGDSKDHMTV